MSDETAGRSEAAERLIEALQQAAAKVALNPINIFLPAHQVRFAIHLDATHQLGEHAGLTSEEVRQVVFAWNDWYSQTPWELSWDRVREAVAARAAGKEWLPPDYQPLPGWLVDR